MNTCDFKIDSDLEKLVSEAYQLVNIHKHSFINYDFSSDSVVVSVGIVENGVYKIIKKISKEDTNVKN